MAGTRWRRQACLRRILMAGSAVYAMVTLGLWAELQHRQPRRLDTSLTPHEFHFHTVMDSKPPWTMVGGFRRNPDYAGEAGSKARRRTQEEENETTEETPGGASSSSSSARPPFVVDVLSIGSLSRPQLLEAQVDTWASHASVRNFWAFTEAQDFDPDCHKMSPQATAEHIGRCTNPSFYGWSWQYTRFLRRLYSLTDGFLRHEDPGWICAQRRVGRALGWAQAVYGGHPRDPPKEPGGEPDAGGDAPPPQEALPPQDQQQEQQQQERLPLPDFLLLVDDDTYFDLTAFWEHSRDSPHPQPPPPQPEVHSGCLMENTNDFVRRFIYPFSFPNGGFGTIFNREMLARWIEPIACDHNNEGNQHPLPSACQALEENRFGEAAVFRPGMSVLDLFYKYSAIAEFCLHSDWLLGYMLTYYSGPDKSSSSPSFLRPAGGGEASPSSSFAWNHLGISQEDCGNHTLLGDIIQCPFGATTCHRLTPSEMETASLHSFEQRPDLFGRQPLLGHTEAATKAGALP